MNLGKNFCDLRKRTWVSLTVVAIVALLVFFSYFPWIELLITALICCIAIVGIWEFAHICLAKGLPVSPKAMMVFGACEVFAIYLNGIFSWANELPIGILLLAMFVFFCSRYHKIEDAISAVSAQFFAICYVAVPLGLMLKILYPGLSSYFVLRDGRIWFIYLICISKITDIGAYFGGRLLGKTKLAPVLSPGKTLEGACIGFACAVLLSIAFSIAGRFVPNEVFQLPLLNAIILGAALSIGAQLGDLAESLLKRDAKVKDSNRLPGLGGVLDMFDSLLFTIPILFFYLHTL